jgi:serine/threonine-protein kinase
LSDDADSRLKAREGSVLDGKWTLERLLGSGGMAAVYMGRHRNGARAAVKILHPELARAQEVRERFLREGYAANQVEHPGAVQVLDDDVVEDGPDKGTAYIVMELLDGESLQERLERGPAMGEVEFLRIAESVLQVLDSAHARGVVHRDLKPENLFLLRAPSAGYTPQVKILDFGLARLLQNQTTTTYGLALGTPSFMSPEQAAGRTDEIDGRTDLFALAATGFRLRAGRRIHEADNMFELVTKMAKVPAPRLATVASGVSEPFARVIDRALEFKREDRYETAAAMLKDVRLAIQQLDAGVGVTKLALPPAPPPPLPRAAKKQDNPPNATIELSESDIEVPRRGPSPEDEESYRIPKRRSVLPWLVLLVAVGIGGKLWGAKAWQVARGTWAAAVAPPVAPVASTPAPAASSPASSSVLPDRPDAATPTAVVGDAATVPLVARADPKPRLATPAPAAQAPVLTRHRRPAKTSPAQILKTKKHAP